MPYTTVVAGTTITASWGNANVRDQVVTPFATASARDSAITSPVEGMLAYLADIDLHCLYDGSAWKLIPRILPVAYKAADESVTSSAALQNDNDLAIPMIANGVYTVDGFLMFVGNETGDIKWAFTFPTGATVHYAVHGGNQVDTGFNSGGTVGGGEFVARQNQTSSPSTQIGSAGSTEVLAARLAGLVVNGANAGNLQLQWAQVTSNGTATTVKTGSWLRLTKVG